VKKLMTIIALAATTAVISAPAFAQPVRNYAATSQYQTSGGAPDWVVDHAKGPIGGR
jgi:hypothetical protein